MIIIGHRGAGGIEPENTLAGIEAAVQIGVDRIEIDLMVTSDKKLVLFHDSNLIRIAGINKSISEMTLKEVSMTATHSGHPIPTFLEAMEAAGTVPVLLDCKGNDWAALTRKALQKFDGPRPIVCSDNNAELAKFKEMMPEIETFASEMTRPFEGMHTAKQNGFTGVSLNFWVLNPLAYRYAMRNDLKIMIYTVNYVFLARYLHLLYPSAQIITNVPDKLAPLAKRYKAMLRNEKSKG